MIVTLFRRVDEQDVCDFLEKFCETRGEPFVLYTILSYEEELKDALAKQYHIENEDKQRFWDYVITGIRNSIPDHTGKSDMDRFIERFQNGSDDE